MPELPEAGSDDNPDGLRAGTSTTVTFKVAVVNNGNETLNGVKLTDSVKHTVNGVITSQVVVYTPDANAATLDATNVKVDLGSDGSIDGNWSDAAIQTAISTLSVGEKYTVYYDLTSTLGQHENTAKVEGLSAISVKTVSDMDDANYFVLPEGPGVRTPGFWQNNNNGGQFWDGIALNEKNRGQDGFADGELLYAVDSDGPIDGNAIDPIVVVAGKITNGGTSAGLLIGDWNKNGITDGDEDTLFISYNDARTLINANEGNGPQSNGVEKLGRDVVATWLNYLAGNDLGSGEGSAQHYLADAVDWFQEWAGKNATKDGPLADTEKFDTLNINAKHNATSTGWLDKIDGTHDGNAMHNALDGYNNHGTINGVFFSGDTDDAAFMLALQQV